MRVLITGAGRGLGFEFARQYFEAGHQVFATARGTPPRLPGVVPIQLDTTDPQSIEEAYQAVRRETGALDLLINNAAVYSGAGERKTQPLGELTLDDGLLVYRTNSLGPLLIAQRFLPLLLKGKNPKLIGITSGYGSISCNSGRFPYHYGASKAALNHYMRSFAFDPKTKGLITVVLSPGWVQTAMGGLEASLSPEESVRGMMLVIDRLKLKANGGFFDYRGQPQSW
jgi:NAD(P)-dependent dehydrogenase (short-subunit alcohol dehydrogenase family)